MALVTARSSVCILNRTHILHMINRVLFNFQSPGPPFFTSLERFFAIKKKSILDLSLRDFDSYVNLPRFGWRIL